MSPSTSLAASPPFERTARLLFWLAFAFAAAMALWPQAPTLALGEYADKWTHVLAFAALTVLAQLGFSGAGRWRIALWLCLFGAGIEVVQAIPALHREASLMDWLVDAAVVLALTVGAGMIRPGRREG